MSDKPNYEEELPQALVDESRRVSLVWLIPVIALLAAAWLGYRAYSEQGPLISIAFQSAEGLEAGTTRVRYKDVDIGLVETIELSPDLSRVTVHARLASHVSGFLNDKTRFWVVRPRLSGGEVTGLSTLLGGTYIGADLTREGSPQRVFDGLEAPPVVAASEQGKSFTLRAETLGSLTVGSPVRYRGIDVGQVTAYELREPSGVDVQVFIQAPHDSKVSADTRFWNISGFQLSLGADGIRIDTESLAALLLGGLAFGTPHTEGQSAAPADEGSVFAIYRDAEAAREPPVGPRQEWHLEFAGSLRGLAPGAPVELRGIRIGEVIDVRLVLSPETQDTSIPVLIAIEPERLGIHGSAGDDVLGRAFWEGLVDSGLRAQLKTGNLVTGAMYVDLDFYPDDPKRTIAWGDGRPQMPTVPTPLDELRGLLSRLARLPLDRMGEDLSSTLVEMRETLVATNALLQRLDRETASELTKTLQQTRAMLANAEKVLAPNSPLQSEAHHALRELAAAARSFRIMADYLERHPEALIRGKAGAQ